VLYVTVTLIIELRGRTTPPETADKIFRQYGEFILLEKRQYQLNSQVCAERGIIGDAAILLEYICVRVRQGELTATKAVSNRAVYDRYHWKSHLGSTWL
jgi:hypothetical protein